MNKQKSISIEVEYEDEEGTNYDRYLKKMTKQQFDDEVKSIKNVHTEIDYSWEDGYISYFDEEG